MQEILGTKRERFKKNLLTLADKDPSLLARVEQSVGEERLIRAENGELTIKDGSLYLESRVSPKKQATRFARLVAGKSEVFLFFGCGLGYHINELVGPQKRGILVEEDIEVFKAALFVLEPAVTERLLLLIGLPAKEAVSKIPYHELEDCSVVAHPISGRVRPRYYEAVENGVRRMLQRELASRVTTVSSQRLWTRNVFRNIGLWKEGYRLLHKGCAKKFFGPVLLVASGPWLEEAMEKIAGLSKKIPVFSLLPSLPYLLSCGVKPDIVLSTDAGFYNRDRARAALDAAGRTRLSLFTTFSADPGMLRVWRGNVLFFSHGLAAETLFGDITGDTLSIPMQGTSALVMILLARALGFDRILLAGYDFAVKGIKDHHRGGGFDTLDLAGSSRFFRWDTAVVSRLAGDGFFGIGAGTNGEKFLKGGDGNAASGIVSGVYGDSIDEKETRGGDDAVISKNAASGIVSGVYGDSIDEKETRGGDDAVISKNAASGGISISTSHKLSLYRTWFEEEILRSDITVLTGETDMDTIPSGSAPLGLASAGFERALEPYEKRLGPNLVLQAMNGVTRRLSEKISYEKRYEMLYGTTQGVKSHGAREDVESVMSLIDRMLEAAGCGSRENGNTYRR